MQFSAALDSENASRADKEEKFNGSLVISVQSGGPSVKKDVFKYKTQQRARSVEVKIEGPVAAAEPDDVEVGRKYTVRSANRKVSVSPTKSV